MLSTRSEFALKDPNALSALLDYDWRIRRMLTDAEALGTAHREGALEGEVSTSLLRHLQRLRWISALHGVRPQGGRMRLWPVDAIVRVQIALDLRKATGAKLAHCVEALHRAGPAITREADGWEHWINAPRTPPLPASGSLGEAALDDGDACAELAAASVANFVSRNRFEELGAPAFLLA